MIWILVAFVAAYLIIKAQRKHHVIKTTRVREQHGKFVDGKFVADDR